MSIHAEERVLWKRWRDEKDPDAFTEIISRHSGLVHSACRRVLGSAADADDVTQECFVELLDERRDVRSVPAWLHTIAVRRSIDRLRRRRREEQKKRELSAGGATETSDLDEALGHLDAVVESLPSSLRVPVVLRFFEGRTHAAIGKELGIAPSAVRYRLEKALARMRSEFKRRGLIAGAAFVSSVLGSNLVEAAPPALAKALGKLALVRSLRARPSIEPDAGRIPSGLELGVRWFVMSLKLKWVVGGLALVLALLLFYFRPSPTPDGGAASDLATADDTRSTIVDFAASVRWNDTGEPVVGARLEWTAEGIESASATTDASGRGAVRVESISGAVRVSADHPGALTPVTIELAAGGELAAEIDLEPRVFGATVVDALSGDPIESALVAAGETSGATDARGAVSLRLVDAAVRVVTVTARGYVAGRLELAPEDSRESLGEIPLDPALTVRCVDETGAPVADAEVFVASVLHPIAGKPIDPSEETVQEHGPVQSGVDGSASFETISVLPRGESESRVVFARIPQVRSGFAQLFTREDDPRVEPIEVVLQPIMKVAGTVLVPDGFSPTKARVRLLYTGSPPFSRLSDRRTLFSDHFDAAPNESGEFELPGAPWGATVAVGAEAPGLGQAQFASAEPEALRAIVLEMRAEGVIEGTLAFAESGEPAAGVVLVAHPHEDVPADENFEAVVGEDGAFRFDGLGVNAYTINLHRSLHGGEYTMAVSKLIRIDSGETVRGVDLELERGALVSGRIVDESTGRTVASAMVGAVSGAGPHTQAIGYAPATKSDGRWELRLPTGRTKVYLAMIPRGFARDRNLSQRWIDIAPGEESKEGIDFLLRPGAQRIPGLPEPGETYANVHGRVVDTDGAPLAGIEVAAHRQYHVEEDAKKRKFFVNPTARTRTSAEGVYTVQVIAEKPYKIRASGTKWSSTWSPQLSVETNDTTAIDDLVLRAGTSTITGIVVDSKGQPLEGARLIVSSESKARRLDAFPTTDATGSFRIEYLIAGEPVEVTATRAGYHATRRRVAPGATDIRLELDSESARSAGGDDHRPAIVSAADAIGSAAPEWSVAEWIRAPRASTSVPRAGSVPTVILFPRLMADAEGIASELQEFETICREARTNPVALLPRRYDASYVEWALEGRRLSLAVGIDRSVPGVHMGETALAFGRAGNITIVILSPEGIVSAVTSSLSDLREKLAATETSSGE